MLRWWSTRSEQALKDFRQADKPGTIVNVGSFFGDKAPAIQSTYSSAKFAVHGFTGSLRRRSSIKAGPSPFR